MFGKTVSGKRKKPFSKNLLCCVSGAGKLSTDPRVGNYWCVSRLQKVIASSTQGHRGNHQQIKCAHLIFTVEPLPANYAMHTGKPSSCPKTMARATSLEHQCCISHCPWNRSLLHNQTLDLGTLLRTPTALTVFVDSQYHLSTGWGPWRTERNESPWLPVLLPPKGVHYH